MEFFNIVNIKIRLLPAFVFGLGAFLIFATYQSVFYRLDPHHDGYVFLPTYLGISGNYPPNVSTAYGIAQPFIESKIFLFFSIDIVRYRFIAFTLILISTYFLYRIIQINSSKVQSLVFACVWVSANPTWANSIQGRPTALQAVWPNLWIQTLTLVSMYLILGKSFTNKYNLILVGIISGTLPYFRFQGIISTFIIFMFVYLKYSKKIFIYFSSFLVVNLLWLLIISKNGGVKLYAKNIFQDPYAYMSDYRSTIYLLDFVKNFANYYTVVGLIFLIFLTAISNLVMKKPYSFYFILGIVMVSVITLDDPVLWFTALIENSSTLLIDSAVALALIFLIIRIYDLTFSKNYKVFKNSKNLTILAVAILVDLIYQYPLPDLGHRWWSSAISVIFISWLIDCTQESDSMLITKKLKSYYSSLAILTLILSGINAFYFVVQKTYTINSESKIFNGIKYPESNQNRISNLQKSSNILTYLNKHKVSINYFCRDGLYYINQGHLNTNTFNALNFLESAGVEKVYKSAYVNFYCNYDLSRITNISSNNSIVLGKDGQTDIFVFYNMENAFIDNIKQIVK